MRQQRRDKEAARQRDARKIAHLEAENKKLKILLDLQKSCRTTEPASGEPDRRLALVEQAAQDTGVGPACEAVGMSRTCFYRQRHPALSVVPPPPAPPRRERALTPAVEERILRELNSERFLDCSPRQVWATLLDENVYLCSWRTMYRLLAKNQAVMERRKIRRHPKYVRPELEASGPNQVWTWDITYLKAPIRGQFYYLYVVIDIYSRLVVGWLLAERECEDLARRLLEQSYRKHRVQPGQLTVHADRGAP